MSYSVSSLLQRNYHYDTILKVVNKDYIGGADEAHSLLYFTAQAGTNQEGILKVMDYLKTTNVWYQRAIKSGIETKNATLAAIHRSIPLLGRVTKFSVSWQRLWTDVACIRKGISGHFVVSESDSDSGYGVWEGFISTVPTRLTGKEGRVELIEAGRISDVNEFQLLLSELLREFKWETSQDHVSVAWPQSFDGYKIRASSKTGTELRLNETVKLEPQAPFGTLKLTSQYNKISLRFESPSTQQRGFNLLSYSIRPSYVPVQYRPDQNTLLWHIVSGTPLNPSHFDVSKAKGQTSWLGSSVQRCRQLIYYSLISQFNQHFPRNKISTTDLIDFGEVLGSYDVAEKLSVKEKTPEQKQAFRNMIQDLNTTGTSLDMLSNVLAIGPGDWVGDEGMFCEAVKNRGLQMANFVTTDAVRIRSLQQFTRLSEKLFLEMKEVVHDEQEIKRGLESNEWSRENSVQDFQDYLQPWMPEEFKMKITSKVVRASLFPSMKPREHQKERESRPTLSEHPPGRSFEENQRKLREAYEMESGSDGDSDGDILDDDEEGGMEPESKGKSWADEMDEEDQKMINAPRRERHHDTVIGTLEDTVAHLANNLEGLTQVYYNLFKAWRVTSASGQGMLCGVDAINSFCEVRGIYQDWSNFDILLAGIRDHSGDVNFFGTDQLIRYFNEHLSDVAVLVIFSQGVGHYAGELICHFTDNAQSADMQLIRVGLWLSVGGIHYYYLSQ